MTADWKDQRSSERGCNPGYKIGGILCLFFENFDFVIIGIGDKGHFVASCGKDGTPVFRPKGDTCFFQSVAVTDNVIDADAGVHEVFGHGYLVFRAPAEFEKVGIAGDFKIGEFVAGGGVHALGTGKSQFFVEGNGLVEIGDANACVEEFHGEKIAESEGNRQVCA